MTCTASHYLTIHSNHQTGMTLTLGNNDNKVVLLCSALSESGQGGERTDIVIKPPPSPGALASQRRNSHVGMLGFGLGPGLGPGSGGIPAAFLRKPSRFDVKPVEELAEVCARELAQLMKESADTEAAVMEYWDMHVGCREGSARSEELGRELLVRLMEELRATMLLARIFLRVT